MSRNQLIGILLAVGLAVFLTGLIVVAGSPAVLNPKGILASQQRDLLVIATLLMLIVVIPVFVMTFVFAWRYRAGNRRAAYTPDWDHHRLAEIIWWAVPGIIIAGLAILTWQSSHRLDPFRPLDAAAKPLTVQVIALQWKWLFVYPEQDIASVNLARFPVDTPINFEITADAPMNSFWIPQLGGQIYAMAGMHTQLHLEASETGAYRGVSANLSGRGFSGMDFTAEATTTADFYQWVRSAKQSTNRLDANSYRELSRPTQDHPRLTYVLADDRLYEKIIMRYLAPQTDGSHNRPGHRGGR